MIKANFSKDLINRVLKTFHLEEFGLPTYKAPFVQLKIKLDGSDMFIHVPELEKDINEMNEVVRKNNNEVIMSLKELSKFIKS